MGENIFGIDVDNWNFINGLYVQASLPYVGHLKYDEIRAVELCGECEYLQ